MRATRNNFIWEEENRKNGLKMIQRTRGSFRPLSLVSIFCVTLHGFGLTFCFHNRSVTLEINGAPDLRLKLGMLHILTDSKPAEFTGRS